METLWRIAYWIIDRPLVFQLWLCDLIAGPMPDQEPVKEPTREDMDQFDP